MNNTLAEKAILMRLSIGLPGENRQDPGLTGSVKSEHNLGDKAGRWVKNLYPQEALKDIKKLDTEARAYHSAITLPFDAGVGILPAALIKEHADRMRQFAGMRANLVENKFLANCAEWIQWAMKTHNGTFDPDLYPGCRELAQGESEEPGETLIPNPAGSLVAFNPEVFRKEMADKFYFKTEPLPVPNAAHFESTVAQLLGTDLESVNIRVQDAAVEAQRELMKRIVAPVRAMVEKLAEQPKGKREDIVFRDTLVGNVKAIAELAPKLNLTGDLMIDSFCQDIAKLARITPEELRDDKAKRTEIKAEAADLLKRLEGYKL